METDRFIKEMYKKYMEYEKERLDKGEIKFIDFKYTYPSLIEEVFGKFNEYPETNGCDIDYWVSNDNYDFSGSMYTGDCRVSMKGDEE